MINDRSTTTRLDPTIHGYKDSSHDVAPSRGSFQSDRSNGYSLSWSTWEEFQVWLKKEQQDRGIQFVRKNKRMAKSGFPWMERHEFVCGRQGGGSAKEYTPKHPEWKRNVPSKRTGCPCRLTVKSYRDTAEILGMYNEEHTHSIGNENLKFTPLSKEVRGTIADMLKSGIETDHIVRKLI